MMALKGLNNGINLGGWLSQYRHYDTAHFQSFITESDIERIAGWGFDHLRLPVDYPVVEDDAAPFQYKEDGFGYIDCCLAWAKKYGLKLILDLHRAPGFDFSKHEEQTLFTQTAEEERYLALWRAFAGRYINEGGNLVFELLNEVVLKDSRPWNELAGKAIGVIREIDAERWIVVGGNFYNSVWTLKDLKVPDDPRLIYTFHFYEPLLFTHQKAPWIDFLAKIDTGIEYPGDFSALDKYFEDHERWKMSDAPVDVPFLNFYRRERLDQDLLRRFLQPAVDFLKQHNNPLYCGEYGVIDRAPLASRVRWQKDFTEILEELGIGRAYWSYKAMDFGLVDRSGRIVDAELVKSVGGRP